jgi:hypothetical protein
MRNVSDKSSRENKKIKYVYVFFPKTCRIRDNVEEPERRQMTIWRISTACRIPKVTNTQSEYVIRVLPLQKYTNASQCYVIRTLPALFFFHKYFLENFSVSLINIHHFNCAQCRTLLTSLHVCYVAIIVCRALNSSRFGVFTTDIMLIPCFVKTGQMV